jgi:hypothetical protein
MRPRTINPVTKIWLVACLVLLAFALLPVFQPGASLHLRFGVTNSHRLQRHSFMNVADGRRPKARPLKTSIKPVSCALLVLLRSSLDYSPLLVRGPWQDTSRLLSHRRKFGRANSGDPDHLV